MKTMKNKVTMLIAMVLFAIALVPAVKTEAASATPSGISLYNQSKNRVQIVWNFDQSILSYVTSDNLNTYDCGYEVQFYTLKNKKFASYNSNNYQNMGIVEGNSSKFFIDVNNSKFKTAGYIVKVRSFYSTNGVNYVYSKWAQKVIIPRATIKNVKQVNRYSTKTKITWNKVSGAKSYTLYMSSNNGKSFKKVTTTKKTSATTKSLKMYTDYVFYVQANGVKYKKKKYNSTKPTVKTANGKGWYYHY